MPAVARTRPANPPRSPRPARPRGWPPNRPAPAPAPAPGPTTGTRRPARARAPTRSAVPQPRERTLVPRPPRPGLAARAGVGGAVHERVTADRRPAALARLVAPPVDVQQPVEVAAFAVDVDVEVVE